MKMSANETRIARFMGLVFITLWLLSGCDNNVEVDYNNPYDPQSQSYIPPKPLTPFQLTATVTADSGVTLAWSDTDRTEEGFNIERKIGAGGAYLRIGSTAADSASYYDRLPLEVGIVYYYRVASLKRGVQSNYSSETTVSLTFPAPPKPLVIATSFDTFQISWSYPQGIGTGFVLEKSINGGQFNQLASVSRNVTSYMDSNVDTMNIYRYRLKAVSHLNESDYSLQTFMQYTLIGAQISYSVNLGRSVNSITFSPDGKMFGASGMTFALRVWNTADGSLVRDFNYTGSGINSSGVPFPLAFSPDGNLVASVYWGTNNAVINVWDISSGTLTQTLHDKHGYGVLSICFSKDNTKIIAGGYLGDVRFWNIANDSLIQRQQPIGPGNEIMLLYLTRDGTRLISGSYGFPGPTNAGIQIWNPDTWLELGAFSGFQSESYSVSYDETMFTSGNAIRSLIDGSIVSSFTGFSGTTSLTYDNRLFFCQSSPGAIFGGHVSNGLMTIVTGASLPDNYTYSSIACSPHSYQFLAVGKTVGEIDLWTLKQAWQGY